jgi:hypothetical protein
MRLSIVCALSPPTGKVDPYHVLTDSFRTQLQEDAIYRARRNAAMLGVPRSTVRRVGWPRSAPLAHGWLDAER